MGRAYESLTPAHVRFIERQRLFFVASAPSDGGHVNVSPKCGGLAVLSPARVAYADLSGSGAETAAHALQNGRATVMLVNLEAGAPLILRMYGRASLLLARDAPPALLARFPPALTGDPGFRAVVLLEVDRVQSSCGYSMPVMSYQRTRTTLTEHAAKEGPRGMAAYRAAKNAYSIDGIPSLAHLESAEPLRPVRVDGEGRPDPGATGPGFLFGETAPEGAEGPREALRRRYEEGRRACEDAIAEACALESEPPRAEAASKGDASLTAWALPEGSRGVAAAFAAGAAVGALVALRCARA